VAATITPTGFSITKFMNHGKSMENDGKSMENHGKP
jgi:hypothetical protein